MKKSILVIGHGKGIGDHLFLNFNEFQHKIGVSRSKPEKKSSIQNICCDVTDFESHVDLIENRVSIVVYVPSEFGESGTLEREEYNKFMETGPQGLLNCFYALKDNELLTDDALIVSIGSTASRASDNPAMVHKAYSIAKATQKAILAQLAGAHKDYRYANITLGGIEDGDKGVGYDNISQTIRHIYGMNRGVRYTEIELKSEIDF